MVGGLAQGARWGDPLLTVGGVGGRLGQGGRAGRKSRHGQTRLQAAWGLGAALAQKLVCMVAWTNSEAALHAIIVGGGGGLTTQA